MVPGLEYASFGGAEFDSQDAIIFSIFVHPYFLSNHHSKYAIFTQYSLKIVYLFTQCYSNLFVVKLYFRDVLYLIEDF